MRIIETFRGPSIPARITSGGRRLMIIQSPAFRGARMSPRSSARRSHTRSFAASLGRRYRHETALRSARITTSHCWLRR